MLSVHTGQGEKDKSGFKRDKDKKLWVQTGQGAKHRVQAVEGEGAKGPNRRSTRGNAVGLTRARKLS